ncbi:MAG: AbrB family transcriptional regulator [Lysinibacillus sp.]
MKAIIKVFAIAFIGAIVFDFFHLPIPWLLGPIFTVLLSQFIVRSDLAWPPILRNTGLVIVGVAIGQQFDLSLFNGMGKLIIYMFIINIILLLCSIFIAIWTSRWANMTLKTSLTGSIPGGLSQLVLFAEEEQDIDLAAVTFFHVVRVVAVVLVIPFIISGHVVTGSANDGVLSGSLVIVLILAACSVWLGKKCRLPVAHFLTPILFIIIVHLAGFETPTVPPLLLHVAQLLIGAYIGLLLKPHMIRLPKRVLAAGVISAVALIGLTYGSSVLLQWSLGYSFATSFLSTAPGGLDQMGLLAAAVGADISIVTVFQLFRLLFIFLIVLPLLKFVCRKVL